jgi:hypothetical protein
MLFLLLDGFSTLSPAALARRLWCLHCPEIVFLLLAIHEGITNLGMLEEVSIRYTKLFLQVNLLTYIEYTNVAIFLIEVKVMSLGVQSNS